MQNHVPARTRATSPSRAALSAALSLAVATALSAQDRTAVRTAPVASPGVTKAPEISDTLTPLMLNTLVVLPRQPGDDRTPAELTRSPKPGFPGDQFGQQEVLPTLLGDPYRLAYVAGSFTPPKGERVDPALLQESITRGGAGETYGFVMFQGRITTEKRARVEALGVRLMDHHTFNSMTAVIPFEAVTALAMSDAVHWVGYAKPWQKIDPALTAAVMAQGPDREPLRMFVKVYRSDLTANARRIPQSEAGGTEQAAILATFRTLPGGECQRRFEALGAAVIDYDDDLKLFAIEARPEAIDAIVAMDVVHSIELDGRIEPAHDRSTRQIGVDYVRSIATNDGHDTVVGMMDSGMDLMHNDVNSHWYAGWGYDGQSPYIDSTGHGTHVMGTVSGTGAMNSRFMGCAPQVGSSQDHRIYIAGIYDGPSANSTVDNAINAFARFATPITINGIETPIPSVVNHSWGVGTSNMPVGGWTGTDSLSIALDYRVFNQHQTHVVAAHNQGGASYASQNLNNVTQPGVAKLALTVANCLDFAENGSYPGRPYFSSNKGPTGDGRLCPQVMAPGRFISSVQAGTTDQYVSFQGTSMATPHVTGTIAGLHTHYTWMKQSPAATRAVIAATSNPYADARTFNTSDDSYVHRQGLGLIDAYKAHYQRDLPGGYLAGRVYGTLDANDGGAFFDVDVPADATRTFFVLAFDEAPASQGAVRACIHDLDLHLDVEPFEAGFDTGEFHATRAWDTWDWYGNVASIGQLQGKRVRVKINPRVGPTGNDVVRFGVAYMIPRGDTTPSGTVDAALSKTLLQPNESFGLTATLDVPEYLQSNAFVSLSMPAAVGVSQLSFVDRGDLPRVFSGGNTPLDWTLGVQGSWFSLPHRSLNWTLRAPSTNGSYQICTQLRSDNRSAMQQDCHTICVDDQAPFLITNVQSPTHPESTWVGSSNFVLNWSPTSDVGCAGLAGYAYTVAFGAATTPGTTPMLAAGASSLQLLLGTSAQDRYIALRAIDNNGNANLRTIYGPVRIDTIDPAISSLSIDGGATFTTDTVVDVTITASDAHSGLGSMRWSFDELHWSPWTPYMGTPFAIDLDSVGGNANEGSRTLHAQVRDLAGNISATAQASITYLRCPMLRGVVNASSLPNVTDGFFDITGADLADITALSFGSLSLTVGAMPPFGNGWCEIVSDSEIRVHPPQGLQPGNYTLTAQNRACRSNALGVSLTIPATPSLAAPAAVTAGSSFRVFVSRGAMPAGTQVGLAVSPSNAPSLAPGVVSFGLGAQFQALLLFPDLHQTDAASGATYWVVPSVPSMSGGTVYLQSFLIDPSSPHPLPAATTNVGAVAFS
ncbi:MAG: S8 family serine peptidase [Planctomycetota bacterium]